MWRDILSVHARTMCEIDRALHPHGLGASDFEVLDILASEPPAAAGDHCRVQNLAGRVHLSQSALSRLIGRLEKDGLVERSVCVEDRRGVWVALTARAATCTPRCCRCSVRCWPGCWATGPRPRIRRVVRADVPHFPPSGTTHSALAYRRPTRAAPRRCRGTRSSSSSRRVTGRPEAHTLGA